MSAEQAADKFENGIEDRSISTFPNISSELEGAGMATSPPLCIFKTSYFPPLISVLLTTCAADQSRNLVDANYGSIRVGLGVVSLSLPLCLSESSLLNMLRKVPAL